MFSPALLLLLVLMACQSATQPANVASSVARTNDPPTCDCCVFDETKSRHWQTRLAPDSAKGQPLRISGTVYESDGKTPSSNTAIYFYHTNAQGYYAKLGTEPRTSHAWWHGYCRGWLRTDDRGRYEINTIRPGAYPGQNIPAHIHFYVNAPSQRSCYYLSDFVFQNDPLVTDSYWYKVEQTEGFLRYGGVALLHKDGLLVGQRDIVLLPQFDRVPDQSGLRVGDDCPAFDPQHVWGPDQDKRTCPMCAYGKRQGLMVWTSDLTSEQALQNARRLEQVSRQRGAQAFKAFIIYTNSDRTLLPMIKPKLKAFALQAGLRDVSVLYVPGPNDKASTFLYNIHPDAITTVLAFRQRRVIGKIVGTTVTTTQLNQLIADL
ncbi:hypothetical protein [Spirosoma montaniterrae]|uniref:Intradiol ring-cleavage dioxygenases domain-containing protein n=1 Tax=Spirosoma montaniterrae TaxID=1178516 RepID=A0A1P9WV66_9BACT|nr:hypothetical protein [Spirosoma montaniterrae]AQG79275.1 hypothetical protein AWR27_08010 [Spirosoma montaniterrae]